MATRIAGLFVDLEASTAKFFSDLDKSRTKATIFGVAIGNITANIAQSFVRMSVDAATALPRLISSQIEIADQLGKTSERTGIAVETLSALRHQASQADVDFTSLTTSISRFTRNVGEAVAGNKEQAATMRALGVDLKGVRAGTVSVEDALFDAIDTLSKTDNQFEKTRLGTDGFGKTFNEIIPIMDGGRAGFAAAREEAEKLGLIVGTKAVQAADDFGKNLKKLDGAVNGIGFALANELLPGLVNSTGAFVEWLKEGNKVKTIGEDIGGVIGEIAQVAFGSALALTGFVGGLSMMAEEIQRLRVQAAEGVSKVLPEFVFPRRDLDDLRKGLQEREQRTLRIADAVAGILDAWQRTDEAASKGVQAMTRGTEHAAKTAADALGRVRTELETSRRETQRIVDALSLQPKTIELPMEATIEEVDTLARNMARLLNPEFQKTSLLANAIRDSLAETVQIVEDMQLRSAALDKTFEDLGLIRPELAQVGKQIAANTREIGDAGSRAAQQFQSLSHTIGTAFEDAILQLRGARDLINGLLQDIARTLLRVNVTQPLAEAIANALGGGGGGGGKKTGSSIVGGIGRGLGAVFGGFFQQGGRPPIGIPSIVAEGGKFEIFVPDRPGTIIPFGDLPDFQFPRATEHSDQTVINLTMQIDARGAEPGAADRILRAAKQLGQETVKQALLAQKELALRSA